MLDVECGPHCGIQDEHEGHCEKCHNSYYENDNGHVIYGYIYTEIPQGTIATKCGCIYSQAGKLLTACVERKT